MAKAGRKPTLTREYLIKCRDSGMTMKEVAVEKSVTYESVSRACIKFAIKLRRDQPGKYTDTKWEATVLMMRGLQEGRVNFAAIGRKLGVSTSRICQIADEIRERGVIV